MAPKLLLLEGFDDAVVGVAERFGWDGPLLAYEAKAIKRILREKEGLSEAEAEVFYKDRVLGAWAGEGTPIFIDTECEFSELTPDTETSD